MIDPPPNRLEILEKFLEDVRGLVGRHENLASSESEHYWNLLDELHHMILQVPQVEK